MLDYELIKKAAEDYRDDMVRFLRAMISYPSESSEENGVFIDKLLKVDNHFIYSTGDLVYINGESKRVSVGAFGHIWTFNKEQLEKALEGNL